MLTTNSTFVDEKNKQQNRPVYLYQVDEYNGTDNLYFTSHDSDVTFDGQTYTKFPITHEVVGDNSRGVLDTVSLTISNVSRLLQAYLENYDWRGLKVTITQVFLDQLADADAKLVHVFYIDNYSTDEMAVSVTLTSKFDVLDIKLPLGVYNRNYCRWKFKSTECGYVGAQSTCNKTKQDCRDNKDNVLRFGGFPSIPSRRLYT